MFPYPQDLLFKFSAMRCKSHLLRWIIWGSPACFSVGERPLQSCWCPMFDAKLWIRIQRGLLEMVAYCRILLWEIRPKEPWLSIPGVRNHRSHSRKTRPIPQDSPSNSSSSSAVKIHLIIITVCFRGSKKNICCKNLAAEQSQWF